MFNLQVSKTDQVEQETSPKRSKYTQKEFMENYVFKIQMPVSLADEIEEDHATQGSIQISGCGKCSGAGIRILY